MNTPYREPAFVPRQEPKGPDVWAWVASLALMLVLPLTAFGVLIHYTRWYFALMIASSLLQVETQILSLWRHWRAAEGVRR